MTERARARSWMAALCLLLCTAAQAAPVLKVAKLYGYVSDMGRPKRSLDDLFAPGHFFVMTEWSGLQKKKSYRLEFILTDPKGKRYLSPRSVVRWPGLSSKVVTTRVPGDDTTNPVELFGLPQVRGQRQYAWTLFNVPEDAAPGIWTISLRIGHWSNDTVRPVWKTGLIVRQLPPATPPSSGADTMPAPMSASPGPSTAADYESAPENDFALYSMVTGWLMTIGPYLPTTKEKASIWLGVLVIGALIWLQAIARIKRRLHIRRAKQSRPSGRAGTYNPHRPSGRSSGNPSGGGRAGTRRPHDQEPDEKKRSVIKTMFLEAWLEHETGNYGATIIKGRFRGKDLWALSTDETLSLLAECRRKDHDSARILESLLDKRYGPTWRDDADADGADENDTRGTHTQAPRDELKDALALFDLTDDFECTALRTRYKTLSQKVHPDRGGSTALQKQVNNAYAFLKRHRGC